MKIRGLNTLTDNALVAAGAAPSAMPGSEVYQALQSGVLDAGLTDLSAAFSRKYYEVQKFGTVGPIFTIYFHMFVNPAWYAKLPAAHRQAIEAAAAKAEQDAIGVTEATAAAALKDLQAKGMTVHVQTPAEQARASTPPRPAIAARATPATRPVSRRSSTCTRDAGSSPATTAASPASRTSAAHPAPWATAAVAGTTTAPELDVRVTVLPPAGAAAVNVTVPVTVVAAPPTTVVGATVTVERFWASARFPSNPKRSPMAAERPSTRRTGFETSMKTPDFMRSLLFGKNRATEKTKSPERRTTKETLHPFSYRSFGR